MTVTVFGLTLMFCQFLVNFRCSVASPVKFSVVWNGGLNGFDVVEGLPDNFVSRVHFENEINATGYIYIILIAKC